MSSCLSNRRTSRERGDIKACEPRNEADIEGIGDKTIINMTQDSSFLGKSYALGSKATEECPKMQFQAGEINKILYAKMGGCKSISIKTEEDIPEHNCKWCEGREIYLYHSNE